MHAQSCPPTLFSRMDCCPPGFSVHRIFLAKILEWVAISYSRRSSQTRDQTHVSCVSYIGKRLIYHHTTWSYTSLTLNQKLEIIKFSEGSMSKAKRDQKWGPLHQTISQVVKTKEKFLKEIKTASPVNTWITRKWNTLIDDMEKILVVCIENKPATTFP